MAAVGVCAWARYVLKAFETLGTRTLVSTKSGFMCNRSGMFLDATSFLGGNNFLGTGSRQRVREKTISLF